MIIIDANALVKLVIKGFRCKADGKLKDEYTTALLKEDWEKRY